MTVVKLSLRRGGRQVLDMAGTGAGPHHSLAQHLSALAQQFSLTEIPPGGALLLIAGVVGGAGRQASAGLTVERPGRARGCRVILRLEGLSPGAAHHGVHPSSSSSPAQLPHLHPGLGEDVLWGARPLGRLALYERRAVVGLLQEPALARVG